MSKRFRIVKRISKEDTGHFEDIEVDDDFVDNEMVQIIADNEYDPLYDDCESIAVALQFAGYGKVADLEAKLAESEKKNFELVAKIKLKEHTPAFCTLADRDCEALSKIAELQKQLAEKDKAIENWQTIYESVVQTCHNDKEEIERLNKKLETQENTITNLVEDNRASQEWYRKQLAEKEEEIEYQENMKILAVENQNKKAIEQLEKVKGLIANHTQELWTCENDDIDVVLYEEIDKQIKQLKEGK